jgi:phospholipid/cholesterol/gamma-HCH transport system substrate-binding protein
VIRRSVWVKAIAFVVIAVLGVGYVTVHYIGVGRKVFGTGYTAYVDLADSGGLFPSASVTYRGVEIGRVGTIALRGDGIRVTLDIATDRKIPADTHAVVGNGSPIGEQFIDLRPTHDGGPYLGDGSVIPQSHTTLPVSTQELLVQLDRLVRSVPQDALHDVVTELGTAFEDGGPPLRRLLDSTHQLLRTAQSNLPGTIDLIDTSGPVLDTQRDLSDQIVSFSRDLDTFTHAVRTGDADLRTILREGVPASEAVTGLEHDIDATLPVLLGNLTSLGRVTRPRVPALRQVLIIYPYVVATSFGLFPGNGSTRFGVPVPPANDHQPCKKGYWPTDKRRLPGALKYPPLRWQAFCKEPTDADINVRGARMAPQPGGGRLGDKRSYRNGEGLGSGDNSASVFAPSSFSDSPAVLGDKSWLWLLFGPMT